MSPTQAPAIPVPSGFERNGDGRLVGLVIDSALPPGTGEKNAWLVAIDDSEHSLHVATAAARMASAMKECSLHLINVQPWLSKEAAEVELARRGWEATAQARALLDDSGHSWHLHIVMGDAEERIVALAERLGCLGIVIGRRGLGVTQSLLFGSVASKVIHLSSLPLLVVR